jgi:hypothetical protein
MAFFRIIKNSQVVNPKLLVIAFAWFAYQIQSLVSINQIGVGVWGWLLSGALIAVASHTQSFDTSDRTASKLTKVKKVKSEETLSPDRLLVGIFVGIIGMVFALPPVVADAQFRKDFTSGNLQNLKMSDEEMGLSNFHLEKALETLVARGLNIEATDLASRIIGKYPRSIYAWQILAAKTQNSEVRQKAIENLRRLDPWNACFETDSAGRIQNWFSEISTAQKLELLRWWGLLPMSSKTEADQKLLSSVPASDLQTRFEGFCR